MKTKLTLVGAGPGDPGLLTLKGLDAIEQADVILYDALVNKDLLALNSTAIKIDVGKRGGKKSTSQREINKLILNHSKYYRNLVRLKGGDPFVFGRGKEELNFAKMFGIEVEVVPGISSAIGLTSTLGISLTERSIASGFWVLTASLQGNQFNKDIALAARSNSTLVVLMGLVKVEQIAQEFKKAQLPDKPVMFVSKGSLPNEKIIFSTIKNIVQDVTKYKIESPAIIVIGDVLKEHAWQTTVELKTLLN